MIPVSEFYAASACVFSTPRILVSGDRPARDLQYRPVPLASVSARLSLGKRLIGEALARNARHKTVQPTERVAIDVPGVEPERKLIDVARQMFSARVVIDAYKPAFKHGEGAFDAVGGDAASRVLAIAVIDSLVSVEQTAQSTIGGSFVRVQRRSGCDAA